MLQAINDRIKGIVGGVIVFLLSVTFASWGIQEYITGGAEKYAASVNGDDVSVREYEEAVNQQRQRYQAVFGANLPTDQAFEQKMKQQVLDQLVLRRVLSQAVVEKNYRISDQMLAENIHAIEAFQQDGMFSTASLQSALGSQGMTIAQFEQLYRGDLMAMQIQSGISKTSTMDDRSLKSYQQLQNQVRTVSYISFNSASMIQNVSLTDEEIQKYFADHQDSYQHPEQASISYIELKADQLKLDSAVDEEQLRRLYDEYVAGLSSSDERKASHILVKIDQSATAQVKTDTRKKLEQVLVQAKSGKSFADLAKQFSDDTLSAKQGGDLGWLNKGMTDPAFETALFAMKAKGEISGIIESGFGLHLIKLDEIKSAKAESFENKKPELLRAAQQQDLDNLFYERSEKLATLAYENDQTLQVAADELGLTIQSTPKFTRGNGGGIAANDAVRKAVFSDAVLKEGRNSEVIELDKNHVAVIRMNEHQPAKPMALQEVRPFVEMALKADKARQQIMATGLQALADAKAGKSLEVIAKEQGGTLNKLGDVQRNYAGVDATIVKAAFKMSKPALPQISLDTVETSNGVALVAVSSVSIQEDARPETIRAAASLLEGDLAEQEMQAVLNYLKSQSDIVVASDLF